MLPVGLRLRVAATCKAAKRCKVPKGWMTLSTLRPPVTVSPRVDSEPPRVMTHRVGGPHARAVAWRAVVAKQLRHMIWICDTLKIRLMTLVAIGVMQLVVAIHVARLARRRCVSTCQREGRRAMIKRRRTPSCC